MAATSSPIHESRRPRVSAQASSWIRGLSSIFRRIALFQIEGTTARVAGVHGMGPPPLNAGISLLEQTPLRWAVEAASPIVGAGAAPGGARIAAFLCISPPRAFAVVPFVFGGRLAALAYVDQASDPLPVSAAGELFSTVGRLLEQEGFEKPAAHLRGAHRSTSRLSGGGRTRTPKVELIRADGLAPAGPREASPSPTTLESSLAEYAAPESRADSADDTETFAADIAEAIAARVAAEAAEELAADIRPGTFDAKAAGELAAGAPSESRTGVAAEPAANEATLTSGATILRTGASAVVTPDGVVSVEDHRTRRPGRWLRYVAPGVFLLAAAIGLAVAPLAPVAGLGASDRVVKIPRKASVARIAEQLEHERIIKSRRAFRYLAWITGVDRDLRAGVYRLPTGAWAWTVLGELRAGQVNTRTVTIPEGLTLSEIAKELEAAGLARATDVLRAARAPELRQKYGIPGRTLEGFLFPETYTMAQGLTASEILAVMLKEFYARLAEIPAAASIASPEQLLAKVTLASIIEREARDKSELKRVSGVFHNRLARNMRLESCATVQYVLDQPKKRLTVADVRTESPYNTYLNAGLPPGPIASPGLPALRAALAPERHDYLFFFAREDGSGRHVFSKTYQEHQRQQQNLRRR